MLLAALTWWITQPRQITEFENVGQPFFAEFEESSNAASLEVLAVNQENAEVKSFRVEEQDGVWTIPSHYGYPAEAADRLAQCSSSLIGLTRESLVGRTKDDHERFGVLDPLDEELLDPEAAGKRVSLKDSSGNVLVDLIIGKQAEERDATDQDIAFGQTQSRPEYYVRRPDEMQTYKIGLDLELSTKFSDWIRPALLDLDPSDLRRVAIDNYELKEQADPLGRVTQLYKKQGDQLMFNRPDGMGDWTLDGLNEANEELDATPVGDAISTLSELKIVGVRKKTGYKDEQLLTPDLKLNRIEELEKNIPLFQQIMAQFQNELSEYGFNLAPTGNGAQDLMLVSNFGEMKAGTENGVVYTLQFGNPIEGDENEIEIGGESDKKSGETPAEPDAKEEDGAETSDPADGSEEPTDIAAKNAMDEAADEKQEAIKNRFLMIRVAFDEEMLGEKPVTPIAPVEPVKPEGYVEAKPADEQPDDPDKAPEPPADDEAPATEADEPATGDEEPKMQEPTDDRPVEFKDYDIASADYTQKKTEYELKLSQFEDEIKVFNERVEAGNKTVAELNERFGAWFYVIAADNLQSLQVKREGVVKAKEVEQQPADETLPGRPDLNLGDEPPTGDEQATVDEQPTDDEVPVEEAAADGG